MIDEMNKKLSIIEIERFAIKDGTGIRTVVFMQGCPLYCPWCANPETQIIGKKLMYNPIKCIGCLCCMKACDEKSISFFNGQLTIDRRTCTLCGKCEEVCVQEAIKLIGEEKTVKEILEVVLKDEAYYKESGGGVTISGGEPFVQFEGLMALLKESKEVGLHTAIETTGQTSLDKIMMAEPFIDEILFDLKHSDYGILQEVIGGNLKLILKNLKYLLQRAKEKVIIRIPIIPGFNTERIYVEEMSNLLEELQVKEVHLLPFHNLGKGKYVQLGKQYTMKKQETLVKKDLTQIAQIYQKKVETVIVK